MNCFFKKKKNSGALAVLPNCTRFKEIYVPGLAYRFLIVQSSRKDANVLNGLPENAHMRFPTSVNSLHQEIKTNEESKLSRCYLQVPP